MSINVDDPSTWPSDLAALAALADTGIETPEPAAALAEAAVPAVVPPVEAAAPVVTPPVEAAAPVVTPPVEAVVPAVVPPVEAAPTNDALLQRAFDAMQADRARAAALEAKLAELQAPPTPAKAPEPEFSAEVLAKAARMKTDWNEDLAEMYLDSVRAAQRASRAEQQVQDLMAQAEIRRQQDQAVEDARINAAIATAPLMSAWQADAQSPYFKRAVALHQQLLENDPDYAAKSWPERFAVLPGKVEAVYGASPHSAKLPPPAAPVTASAAQLVPASNVLAASAPKADAPAAPVSLSDLPAGAAPTADPTVDLARMSGPQLQQHLTRLAATPDAIRALLAQYH